MMIEFTANDNLIKGATEEAKQDLVLDQNYSHHCLKPTALMLYRLKCQSEPPASIKIKLIKCHLLLALM